MVIKGTLTFSGDKSISHRALMFSALADGESRISNLSTGADVQSTRKCLEACGIEIRDEGNEVIGVTFLSLRGENASEGRGNPSCVEGRCSTCLFVLWFTVVRRGLSALAMTKYFTPGLRLLAWPFWAAAPLVQARRAPPFYPLVPSSFRP